MIAVLTTGLPNTVQDPGRPGRMGQGVAPGGAMDRFSLAVGNALLGNGTEAAGIEVAFFPFRLRFDAPATLAVTGADCAPTLDGLPLPPCWAVAARAGQVLELRRPLRGARSYVTLGGGIDVPLVLGSRSTDGKTGFGGLDGRGLRRGDRLSLLPGARPLPEGGLGALTPTRLPLPEEDLVLRVLPAAEAEGFDAASVARFRDESWRVTADTNRMGMRLEGSALFLSRPVELLSHGIVPGTVQVPPAGLPMIQLADANTCGGYPKIATVIEADLPLLGQAAVGSRLRFVPAGWAEAQAALADQVAFLADLERTAARIRAAAGRPF